VSLSKQDYDIICDALLDMILYIKFVKQHHLSMHDMANNRTTTDRDLEQEIREAVMVLNQVMITQSESSLNDKVNKMKKELRL